MLDLTYYFDTNADLRPEEDFLADLSAREDERKRTVLLIQHDLIMFGKAQGYTQNQIRGAVEALFSTYAAEWSLYILMGSGILATAIQNDTSLTWLDLDANGQTIRTRLLNRIS